MTKTAEKKEPEVEAEAVKVEAPKAEKKPAAKKAAAPKAEKKTAAKKAAAPKAEKKTAAKKAAAPKAEKKTAAKKPAAKKAAAPKAAKKGEAVFVQFAGAEWNVADVKEKVVAAYVAEGHKKSDVKELSIYVKPEENKAYYVINGETESKSVEL